MRLSPLSRFLTPRLAGRRARPVRLARHRIRVESLEDRTAPAVALLGIPDWGSQGPGPVINGQTENIASTGPGVNPVVGAVHALALHPTNSNIAYFGSVSGGVFRTTNFTAANPTYTPLTDQFANTSIGALVFDPTDASNNTLYAGIGSFSSFNSGLGFSNTPLGTLLRTTDGGNTWTQIATATPALGGLAGVNVSGIVARGNNIVVTANNLSGGAGPGVYRSTDGGTSFQFISGTGAGATPLGVGAAFDIVPDPTAANRIYVSVQGGLFRTDDFTAANITWVNVSQGDPALNAAVTAAGANNIEMAMANNGRIYAAAMIVGQVRYIGFSDNQGGAWTEMDLPVTTDSSGTFSLQPREHPGSQGNIHFSIIADPNTPTLVYVGGDRQPGDNSGTNALGATDFTARLFRGDTTVAAANPGSTVVAGSPQWDHLTHTQNATFNGGGTNNNSAPHADSRDMAFRADGILIEVDDGGVYGRTNPQNNTGGWFSLNSDAAGGLRVTEIHDIAYDNNSDIIMSGHQDIGTAFQTMTGSQVYTSVPLNPAINFNFGNDNFLNADGGDVVIDNQIGGGQSLRYHSIQNFGNPVRQVYNAANGLVSQNQPALNVPGGTPAPANFPFVTPLAVNEVAGGRLIIGAGNGVYESTDRGDNLVRVSLLAANRTAISYGASQNGVANPNALFVGSGNQVIGRTAAGNLNATAALPNGPGGAAPGNVTDVEMNPANFNTVIAIDNSRVYMTTNAGTAWADITGNLADINLRSIEYVPNTGTGPDAILVGGAGGVFRMLTNNPNVWSEFGNQLPNSVAYDMDYDATDDLVVVGTLGRGAWSVGNLAASVFVTGVVQIDGDTDFPGQDDIIRLVRNPNNPGLLEIYLNSPTPTEVVTLASVQQINVNGLGGNDTLIVDSTNGLITVPNGIRYNGGTGVDNLRLDQTGGPTRTSAIYDVGPTPGTGKHTINGGAAGTQTVFFEELAPVVDAVPALSLIVNATPAVNAISYTTGTLVTQGRVTVDEQESIEFANHGTLVLNAGGGGDTVSLNNPNPVDGLTGITVNGGDPTSGDALIVNGTAATVSVNSGTRTITGAGTVPITYDVAIEALTVNAGPSTTLALSGSTSYTYTPGAAANAGAVQTVQIPIAFTGIGAGENLTLTGTSAVINGTAGNDTFTASGAAGTVTLGGRATIGGTAVGSATVDGQDGADTVNATATGAVSAGLGGVTASLTGGGLGTMSVPNVEVVNLSTGAAGITVNGTAGPNAYAVTPNGATTATVQVGGLAPVLNTTNSGALTIADGTAGDGDLLTVNGTAAGETITVNSATTTVQVGGLKAVAYSAANVEALRANGNAGADTFDVTPGSRPIFIDGGDPVGVLPGDLLNILAGGQTVTVTPGPETDEGGIDVGANATVSYDHVESISITGGGPAVVNGTNGNDAITVVARDSSYNPAADGNRDFTAAVNNGPEILFIDSPAVTVNALAGSDTIVIRTPAPNNAVWNVAVTVDGGPPSVGIPAGSDRLVVETPGGLAETAVYTPTASDAGTLDLTSLTSPIAFTAIEELLYDGEADNDSLTIAGTVGPNTFTATPGAAPDAGALAVDGTLPIAFSNLGPTGLVNVTGNGGADTLVYNGTAANDLFTINAGGGGGVVTLNSQLPINTTGVGTLRAEGFGGDDTFTLVPAISGSPYAALFLNGGAQASAAGDQANLKGTPGPAADSIAVSGQTVGLGGVTVASSGVENINLDSDGGTDLLTYNGVPGVTEAISVAGSTTPGTGVLGVPGVAQVTFVNTETFVVNGNPADVDTVKVVGTNAVDRLEIDLAAAGTAGDPVLLLQNAGGTTTALTLINYTGFNVLNVDSLDGDDVVNVYTAATGPSRNLMLDGGAPAGKQKGTDLLNVFYAGRRPRIVHSAATQNPHSGLVTLDYGTAFFSVQYASMEDVRILKL